MPLTNSLRTRFICVWTCELFYIYAILKLLSLPTHFPNEENSHPSCSLCPFIMPALFVLICCYFEVWLEEEEKEENLIKY